MRTINNFSAHAQQRGQQRCIPQILADHLLRFGMARQAHDNCRQYYLTQKSLKRARRELDKQDYLLLEKKSNCYLILNEDKGIVVTMGYIGKRIKYLH
jgi:hypothetical protein